MARKHVAVTHEPRQCAAEGCGATFTPTRSDQRYCGATCRQRAHRGTYVVTEADRALIRRLRDVVPIPGVPRDPPTREEVEAHVRATARYT